MATKYYLQFVPYGGPAESLDGGSLYAVSNLDFGADQTLNIGSQSTGAGAGKVTFNPLNFTLGSSNLTARLDQMLASGTAFQQVNLYAVNPQHSATPVITDTFKLAAVKSDSVDAGSGAHNFAMEYGGLVESSAPQQNPNGSLGASTTQGWNRVRNVSDSNPNTVLAGEGPSTPGTAAPFNPLTDVAAGAGGTAQNLHLYVQLRNASGALLGGPSGGWIQLDSATFQNEQTLNIGSQSTGAGAGKVTFDPLSLSFKPGTLEPLLFEDLASGTPLNVEVAAYGSSGKLVDDYHFGNAAFQTSERAISDGTASNSYTLQYGQEQITHKGTNDAGQATSTTQGWDRVKNIALNSPLAQNAPLTETTARNQLATIATAESGQTKYYLQFVPYGGPAESLDGGSLYAVSNLDFGADQTLNIGSQSTGAGAGKVTFNPLNFTLGSSNLTARLDQMLASGTAFQQVNLYAVNPQHSATPVITDTFKLAAVKSDSVDAGSGAHNFAMEYGGLVESSAPQQNPNGSLGASTTQGWNRVRNVSDSNPNTVLAGEGPSTPGTAAPFNPLTDVAAGAGGTAQNLHLYVQLRNASGALLGGPSGGWIQLDSATFQNEQTLNIGSQSTGAGAGKVTFDPLSLSFKPGTLEPLLFEDLASGTPLNVEVAAYGSSGKLVDDYHFGNAAFQTSERAISDGTASNSYTLQYGQEQITHKGTNDAGQATSTTQGWDRVKNIALNSPLAQNAPLTETTARNQLATIATAESGQTKYYLQFVPYGGPAESLDGGSLYAVSNLDFGADQTLNIGSQSTGAGAGKVTFNPLNFTLGSSNLTARLDQMLASGTAFQQVNLYAVNPQHSATPVITDTFKLAAVKSDSVDAGSGAHNFAMEYGGLVESSAPQQNPNGSLGASTTQGWNRVRNVSDSNPNTVLAGEGPSTPGTAAPFNPLTDVAAGAGGTAQNLHLYVQLRNASGALLGGPSGGWIQLDSATFQNEQTLNIGSQSTGAGAGKVTFDPLSLSFKPGTLEPLLFEDLASGTPLNVEVAAYGSSGKLVDDYHFGNAAFQTSERAISDGTASNSYTVQYGQEQITHKGTNDAGQATSTTQGWDRVKNIALNSPLAQNAPLTETTARNQLATIATAEGSADSAPTVSLTTTPASTLEATSSGGAAVDFAATDTDAVDGSDPVTFSEIVNGAAQAVISGETFGLGSHVLTASASDHAGNIGTKSFGFTVVDTTPPALSLTTTPASTINATSSGGAAVDFAATDTDAVDVSDPVTFSEIVNGAAQAVISGETFGLGSHVLTASASDHAGNIGTKSFGFTVVDTTPPALSLTTTPASTINATSSAGAVVDFAATDTDAVDGSDPVTFSEIVNGEAQAVTSGETFGLGSHVLTASATDRAGNTSTKSFSFTVMGVMPQLVIAFDANVKFSSATRATFTGMVSNNVGVTSVTLFEGDSALGAATINPDGTWSFAHDFGSGIHTGISARVTDASGNSASAASNFDLTTATPSGIPGQPYTSVQDHYAADGTFLGQTFFKANGAELFASTYTALPDGGSSYTYSGGKFFHGKSYSSFTDTYDASGVLTEDIRDNRNGSHTIGTFTVEADTSGQQVHSIGNDLFANDAPNTQFVFSKGFGHDTIEDFKVAGPGHDTIALPSFDMSNLAQILAAAQTVHGATTIQVDKQNSITLVGVTKAELKAHPGDFTFHP